MSASNSLFAFLVMCGFLLLLLLVWKNKIFFPNLLKLLILCVLNPLFFKSFSLAIALPFLKKN